MTGEGGQRCARMDAATGRAEGRGGGGLGRFNKASTASLGHFNKASTASLGRFKRSLFQAWGDHDDKQYVW
jgi:hypothetical protein